MLERDPPARRLALVRWLASEKRYELLFEARAIVGARRLIAKRAAEHPGSQVVPLFCSRDGVGAAVAGLRPARDETAFPRWRQPPLF